MEPVTAITAPEKNDRIMAALAHVMAILPMVGLVAPIVVWVTHRDRSEYVAFQALQAAAYQLTLVLAWFAVLAVSIATFFTTFIGLSTGSSSETFPGLLPLPFVLIAFLVLSMLAFTSYGLLAGAMVLQGRDFHYLLIGDLLERYLQHMPEALPANG